MKIKRLYENYKMLNQDTLEDFLLLLENEFDLENEDNFGSSSIEYSKGFMKMNLNFVVLAEDEIKKIMKIRNYLDGCLNGFVIRPLNEMIIECHFRLEHNKFFVELHNELKMKSDSKKYNL